MIIVLTLVGIAGAVTLAAPALLPRGNWSIQHPRLALRLWLTALLVAVSSLLLSVVIAATIVAARVDATGFGATVAALFAWCSLAVAGGVAALVATNAEPISAAKHHTDAAVEFLVARSAVRIERIGDHEVIYVDTREPIACSSSGGRILISSGIEAAMSPSCVRAIIEHERAHIRLRHGLIDQVATLNASAFPRLRTARTFRRTVALLIELVADDAAAHACGPAAVCNALTAMARVDPAPGLNLRAARLAQVPVHSYPHRRPLAPLHSGR